MFTGIIEELGTLVQIVPLGGGLRLMVEGERSAAELQVNDSVAINGVCQTVVRKEGKRFEVVAVEETLRKTTLGSLKRGDLVNLELPMRLNERLGGHLVLGHVDCVGTIQQIERRETSWMFTLVIPREFDHYVVDVGSIAVDGVSLTVAGLQGAKVHISVIPHTMENTVFKLYAEGSRVNVEFDLIGKYVERLLHPGERSSAVPLSLNEQQLREMGY